MCVIVLYNIQQQKHVHQKFLPKTQKNSNYQQTVTDIIQSTKPTKQNQQLKVLIIS